jgi:hypothetical protein
MIAPSTILAAEAKPDGLRIGWASADITPEKPVTLRGYFRARVSEGVLDPLTATALALESVRDGAVEDWTIMVSLDLIAVGNALRDRVREHVRNELPDLDPGKVFFNATHTHVAPSFGSRSPDELILSKELAPDLPDEWATFGIELDAMPEAEYREFAAERIARAVVEAWNARKPGAVGFGLGHAVVGQNRLIATYDGRSAMYGATDRPQFSHVEGYEDHSVNLLYTWDAEGELTGVVINLACPSQAAGGYQISADFWHDTRLELRSRVGEGLFVLPQCAAAGDQSPSVLVGKAAEARMDRLAGRNRRQEIAVRIADAVTSTLTDIEGHAESNPAFAHRAEQVELPRRLIPEEDVASAMNESDRYRKRYETLRREIEENPDIRKKKQWYSDITDAFTRMKRGVRVKRRFEAQKAQPTLPYEVHVVRIGDMAIATNPFELYLDYGIQIKARSKAVQTFIVQLAGDGAYLPTQRSVEGGAYGAVPASTDIGPEGGRVLVERTLELIESLWAEKTD